MGSEAGDKMAWVIQRLREYHRRVEEGYDSAWKEGRRANATLDWFRGSLPFDIDHLESFTDPPPPRPRPKHTYLGRSDGLMIELQRVPHEVPLDERFIEVDELLRMAEADDLTWSEIWQKRGFTAAESKRLREAFSDLEAAWIVFWQSGEPERALWRLVDAAGLLAEVIKEDREEATGRGYRIEKVPPHCAKGHRWNDHAMPTIASNPPGRTTTRKVNLAQRPALPPRPLRLDPRRTFTPLQKAEIFLRSNGHCCACGIELGDVWHADHIVPHAWGGLTEVRNGQSLCQRCNQRKHAKILTVDGEEGA